MKVYVIDSSVIFLRKAHYDHMITIPEVVEEIKDEKSKFYFSLLDVRVEEPSEESVKKVVEVAKKTGDIHKLSKTDVKLLAKTLDVAKEGKDVVLVTDDYSIQNVAMFLGLKIENIIQPAISKAFKWVKVCRGCGRRIEGDVCPVCGSEAIVRRVKGDRGSY